MRLQPSKKITLGAMAAALSVLCLYAAGVLPWSKVTCCFLSSLFVYVLAGEGAYLSALTSFFASAGIAFLLLPDKSPLYAYAALLGHYGIFKTIVEANVQDRVLRWIFKLLYCNAFTLGALALCLYVFKLDIAALLPAWQLWMLLAALEAAFIGYDVLYTLCIKIYVAAIRDRILPRR